MSWYHWQSYTTNAHGAQSKRLLAAHCSSCVHRLQQHCALSGSRVACHSKSNTSKTTSSSSSTMSVAATRLHFSSWCSCCCIQPPAAVHGLQLGITAHSLLWRSLCSPSPAAHCRVSGVLLMQLQPAVGGAVTLCGSLTRNSTRLQLLQLLCQPQPGTLTVPVALGRLACSCCCCCWSQLGSCSLLGPLALALLGGTTPRGTRQLHTRLSPGGRGLRRSSSSGSNSRNGRGSSSQCMLRSSHTCRRKKRACTDTCTLVMGLSCCWCHCTHMLYQMSHVVRDMSHVTC